jgi:putative tryptophan/tyrosine transport system substrate-binding protein
VKRREFIVAMGGAAVWPLVARAQQGRVWRIGYLHPGSVNSGGDAALFDAFRQELSSLGYVEGKNLVIESRYVEGQIDRLPAFANELASLPSMSSWPLQRPR